MHGVDKKSDTTKRLSIIFGFDFLFPGSLLQVGAGSRPSALLISVWISKSQLNANFFNALTPEFV